MYRLIIEVPETGNGIMLHPNKDYTIASIEGLNPPPAMISGVPLPISDGQVFSNSRIDTRSIVLTVYINNPVEANRINLYSIFPVKRLIRLNYSNGIRNVMAEGYVESFEISLFAMRQAAQITIKCIKPYLESTDLKIATLDHTSEYFEFPVNIEDPPGKVMSEERSYAGLKIENGGDIASGCIIEIESSDKIEDNSPIIIYDEVNRTHMRINTDMYFNTKIRINTNPGQRAVERREVYEDTWTNWINYLDYSSTWLKINPGVNVFSYSVSGKQTTDLLEIKFTYRENFLGV